MRLGIMQPYFFPHLGHFALIAHSDEWLVFDVTQYTPKSWMNRNRVLHPSSGWMYVTVPVVAASRSVVTRDVRVSNPPQAHASALGKLSHYARPAPFFSEVKALVDHAFEEANDDGLVALNVAGLRGVCDYLGLEFNFSLCSKLDVELPPITGPGEWAPALCEAVGADAYINPAGGRHLFELDSFRGRDISLNFLEMPPLVYGTGPFHFEPQLSILDVLMWNSPSAVRNALLGAKLTRVADGAS